MNTNVNLPVEIVYIIDRSGSMDAIANDAIGGFNSSLENNKKLPDKANVTVVLFDDKYEFAKDSKGNDYYRVDLQNVENLTNKTYVPRGMTALNDAIGRTLSEFKRMKSEAKLDKAIFVILTDGQENSSREFSSNDIKQLRENCEKEFGWDFIFLAANQDAFATGTTYGFTANNTANYAMNSTGIRSAFVGSANKMATYRSAVSKGVSNEELLNATHSTSLQDDVSTSE